MCRLSFRRPRDERRVALPCAVIEEVSIARRWSLFALHSDYRGCLKTDSAGKGLAIFLLICTEYLVLIGPVMLFFAYQIQRVSAF